LEATESFQLHFNGETHVFSAGSTFVILGERPIDRVRHTIAQGVNGFAFQVGADGKAAPRMIQTFSEVEEPMSLTPPSVRFTPKPKVTTSVRLQGQNYDLIFAGTDSQGLRFQFRTFEGVNLDRPATSQDISFPIGTRQIQYREMKIDIDAVTPTAITYRVIQPLAMPTP
jgi:hypothetical protein